MWHWAGRQVAAVILLMGLAGAASGQDQPGEVFKSGVTMIQVPVVVRDRDGHVVGNLKKDDFQLFDNGKRVEIAAFSLEKPGAQLAPDRSLPDPHGASHPGPAGVPIDLPQHFLAYFFDDLSLGPANTLPSARDAAVKQIGALAPGDRVGIFTSSCAVSVDFTADRAKLLDALAHLQLVLTPSCRDSRPAGPRVAIMQIETLQDVVKRMANLPGRREVLFVSAGFRMTGSRHGVEDLIDAAVPAKVIINALDTGESAGSWSAQQRTGPDSWDRNAAIPGNTLMLEDIAHATAGTYVMGNDYVVNFRKLSTPESYYVLSFVPETKSDGARHQLKVKLEAKGKYTVDARTGYDAPQH